MDWTKLADDATIEKTAEALRKNGFEVFVVSNGEDAKAKALALIPQGSEVFAVTSTTTISIGLAKEINESGKYDSVRNKISSMDRSKQMSEIKRIGSSPDWVVGSVHAVTEDGKVLVASATGSQFAPYSYGASHVIWVVGTQKIVKDTGEGIKRINEYSLPLESERVKKAYGMQGSSLNKILIFNKETPGRITIILAKEQLGF
jgi:hypothetical protein